MWVEVLEKCIFLSIILLLIFVTYFFTRKVKRNSISKAEEISKEATPLSNLTTSGIVSQNTCGLLTKLVSSSILFITKVLIPLDSKSKILLEMYLSVFAYMSLASLLNNEINKLFGESKSQLDCIKVIIEDVANFYKRLLKSNGYSSQQIYEDFFFHQTPDPFKGGAKLLITKIHQLEPLEETMGEVLMNIAVEIKDQIGVALKSDLALKQGL